ncbi:MAG: HAD family phosphatase [Dehalococcoidales bacterium]|nr:HAD family phosphatase [Dehalococcoidales bacterium]
MGYKLLILDIDGTLVGKDGTVSPEDKQALKQAIEAGVIVSLCTGRAFQGSLRVLKELSLDGYHTFHDGAQVFNPDTGHSLFSQPLKPEVIGQLIDWAHLREMDIELYSLSAYYSERENWTTQVHRSYFDIPVVITDYDTIIGKENIIKMQTVVTNREQTEKAIALKKEFNDRCHFSPVKSPAFPDVDFINIISPEVSKGKAIGRLATHLNIKKEEIMAMGDGINDIPLVTAAGLGIAMGDAPEELKKAAKYTTASVEESGIAKALKKFLL